MSQPGSEDNSKNDRHIEMEKLRYEHDQFRFMLWIILGAFLFGALVLIAAVGTPFFFLQDRPTADIAQFKDLAKDVLPYATGVIGFAGGLASAFFGRRGK